MELPVYKLGEQTVIRVVFKKQIYTVNLTVFTSLDCLIVSKQKTCWSFTIHCIDWTLESFMKRWASLGICLAVFLAPSFEMPAPFLPTLFPDHQNSDRVLKVLLGHTEIPSQAPRAKWTIRVQGHLCWKGLKTDQPRPESSQKNQLCSPPISAPLARTDLTPRLEEMLTSNSVSHHP